MIKLEDLAERSNFQELKERLEDVNGEYCYVGDVHKVDTIHFAKGLAQSEMIEVSTDNLAEISPTMKMKKPLYLSLANKKSPSTAD